jgi:hypothetical protein
MVMNDEFGRTRKEEAVAYFKELRNDLKNHKRISQYRTLGFLHLDHEILIL